MYSTIIWFAMPKRIIVRKGLEISGIAQHSGFSSDWQKGMYF